MWMDELVTVSRLLKSCGCHYFHFILCFRILEELSREFSVLYTVLRRRLPYFNTTFHAFWVWQGFGLMVWKWRTHEAQTLMHILAKTWILRLLNLRLNEIERPNMWPKSVWILYFSHLDRWLLIKIIIRWIVFHNYTSYKNFLLWSFLWWTILSYPLIPLLKDEPALIP